MIFNGVDDNVHNSLEQIKRFEKAVNKNFIIPNLNIDSQTAQFVGSDGELYITSLTACSCIDCSIRRLPCKHMYKLAIECGLINIESEPWNTYREYSKILYKAKKMLNSLDIPQLNELMKYIKTL